MIPSEIKESIEKVASSCSLETNIKREPFETGTELYSLSISICKQNIVKILKSATKINYIGVIHNLIGKIVYLHY